MNQIQRRLGIPADSISSETALQNEGALFRDLHAAMFEPALSADRFATQAAREWLDLAPTNQKILRHLGYL